MLPVLQPSRGDHSSLQREAAFGESKISPPFVECLYIALFAQGCGVIPLGNVTLVEDINTDPQQHSFASVTEEDSNDDTNSNMTDQKHGEFDTYINRLFRLIVESRDQTSYSTTFVANDENHKSEWCTDIAQCLQNLRYTELVSGTFRNESSVIAPESVK